MQVDFTYRPLPVHVPFHRSSAPERALFGAFGSGKTYGIVAEAIAWCLEQPGIRGLIARKTVPELRDTVEPIFFEMLPPELYAAGELRRSGGHAESFTFPNGSVILFRSLDDWNKHRSLNVGFIAYDEANEIDEETYDGMLSRVRQRDITDAARRLGYTHEITRRGVWLATNPNGHDWLYDRFVDARKMKPHGQYFRSTSFDNPYLPVDYLEKLMTYPEPWIRRYVLCQFDDFAGQVYPDWAYDTHVERESDLPLDTFSRSSMFWMGMDPGTRNPTAGVWAYVDRKNRRLVAVREYEREGTAATEHAKNWRMIEAQLRGRVARRISDPSIMTRDRGTNMSLHSQYQRLGYNFDLGPKTYDDRIPALGAMIATGRFVCTTRTPLLYESLKNYRWEDITPAQKMKGESPREKPLKKNDHLNDCAQYLASRWQAPLVNKPPEKEITFNDEIHATIRKQLRRKQANRTSGHDLGSVMV